MVRALSVNLDDEALHYAMIVAKGQMEFAEIPWSAKVKLYDSGLDLERDVPSEQLERFEDQLALRGQASASAIPKAVAREAKRKLR